MTCEINEANGYFIDGNGVTTNLCILTENHEKTQSPDVFEIPMADSDEAIGLLFSGARRSIELSVLIKGEDATNLVTKLEKIESFCAGGDETLKRATFTFKNFLNREFTVIAESIGYRFEVSEMGVYNIRVDITLVEVSAI